MPRVLAAALVAACLGLVATPAQADSGGDVAAAKQAVADAQAKADKAALTLAGDQSRLLAAQSQLSAQTARIGQLNAQVGQDTGVLDALERQIRHDRAELAAFMRSAYESGGNETAMTYVLSAHDIGGVMQRAVEIGHMNDAGNRLILRIAGAEKQAQKVLAATTSARQAAQSVEAQMATEAVIIASDAAVAQQDADAAAAVSNQAQRQLTRAEQAAAEQAAAAAAGLAAARHNGTIFLPMPGPLFTADTDLTLPSGETAQILDGFLAGTALAGLGASYVKAEQAYHVSARYLVAHSIEESAFGTSAIARSKHNIFGYGANDANPFVDASYFPTFDACIQFVAQKISTDYLTVGGSFYHGPTLRGMNVNYATDPLWASKIAAIARTVPGP